MTPPTAPLSIASCSYEALAAELGDPLAGRQAPRPAFTPARIPERLLAHPATELARPTSTRPPVPPRTRPIPRAAGATSTLRRPS